MSAGDKWSNIFSDHIIQKQLMEVRRNHDYTTYSEVKYMPQPDSYRWGKEDGKLGEDHWEPSGGWKNDDELHYQRGYRDGQYIRMVKLLKKDETHEELEQ